MEPPRRGCREEEVRQLGEVGTLRSCKAQSAGGETASTARTGGARGQHRAPEAALALLSCSFTAAISSALLCPLALLLLQLQPDLLAGASLTTYSLGLLIS